MIVQESIGKNWLNWSVTVDFFAKITVEVSTNDWTEV